MRIMKIQNGTSDSIKSGSLQGTKNQTVQQEKENLIFTPVKEEIDKFNKKSEKKQKELEMLKKLEKVDIIKAAAAAVGGLACAILLMKAPRKPKFKNDPVIDWFGAYIYGISGFVGTMLAGSIIAAPFKYDIMKKEYADVIKDNKKYQGSNFWCDVFMFTDSNNKPAIKKQGNHKK